MSEYELTVIVDPGLSAEDQKKLITKIKKLVADFKGKVGKIDTWGKRELSYPIKKKTTGYYYCLKISLPAEVAAAFAKKVKLEETIYRLLLISLSNKG